MHDQFGVDVTTPQVPESYVPSELRGLLQSPIMVWELQSWDVEMDAILRGWKNPGENLGIMQAMIASASSETMTTSEEAKSELSRQYTFTSVLSNLRNVNTHKDSPMQPEDTRRSRAMNRFLNWMVLALVKSRGVAFHKLYKSMK